MDAQDVSIIFIIEVGERNKMWGCQAFYHFFQRVYQIQLYRSRNVRFLTLNYFELKIIWHANVTLFS